METKRRSVAAYIRVSTDNQCGEDRYGLEAQREQIIDYCERNNMDIVKWFSDEGESGAKYRPGFDQIIYGSDVTNPPYEAVVVAKSDRVARDVNIYFYYSGALLRKNIELISISEDFGQFGAFAGILKAFTLTCAELERENITKRTSAGRSVKASYGGYSGGRPPLGYRVVDGKLEIVPDQKEIVLTVFKMKDDEGKTYREIAEYINSLGIKGKRGSAFCISTVQAIYENKMFYKGFYKYGKQTEYVRGMHEPILK